MELWFSPWYLSYVTATAAKKDMPSKACIKSLPTWRGWKGTDKGRANPDARSETGKSEALESNRKAMFRI